MSLWSFRPGRRIGYNAAVKLASEVVARAASFGLVLLAARRLGEADFGRYNYGLALGFVVAQLADFGLQVLLAREVAAHGRAAQPLVRGAFRLKLLLSLPVIVLLWLLTPGGDPAARWALFGLGIVALGQTYLEFAAYVFRGQQDLLTEARIVAGARLLTAGLGVAILLAGGGLLALALISVASVLLLVGASLRLLWRTGWLGASAEPADERAEAAPPGLPLYRRLLREAAPLGLSIFLSIAYSRLAVLLLQARLGESAVATFSAAHRLVEPSQILPASLIAAVFPAFSHALCTDPPGARRLGARASLLLAAAGAGAALTLWLAAGWIIPLLYGDAYAGSAPVLRVLGLSILPAFVNYSLTHYLIARGQQGVLVIFSAVMLAAHAGLSWLWMPRWGALGPAISVVIAESLLLVFCLLTLILTKPLRRPGPHGELNVVAPPESARPGAAGAAPPV